MENLPFYKRKICPQSKYQINMLQILIICSGLFDYYKIRKIKKFNPGTINFNITVYSFFKVQKTNGMSNITCLNGNIKNKVKNFWNQETSEIWCNQMIQEQTLVKNLSKCEINIRKSEISAPKERFMELFPMKTSICFTEICNI